MDKFEKHIKENISFFNEHKADSDKMWSNIENALNEQETIEKPRKKWRNNYLFKIAASIAILLGLFTFINNSSHKPQSLANKEFSDIEVHYKAIVNYQVSLVNKSTKLTNEDKKEFLFFMDELDEEHDVLKIEIQKNINSEQVLEALVLNYKKRIEIIEKLLKQINNNSEKTSNNEYIL